MMKNMRKGIPNLFKEGTKYQTGLEAAVLRNLEACRQLWEITRTSFGPNGMNKMIINHLDKTFVTSDCATIMKEMEIDHPAAKLIVLAAQMQEQEIGDGSNYVVCIAGSLLDKAAELINMGLHPSEIIAGYNIAGKKALEILDELAVETVSDKDLHDRNALIRGMWSAVSAKQYGYEQLLTNLIADACLTVMPKNTYNFNVDNVRVVKLLGGNLNSSHVVRGMVVNHEPIGSVHVVEKARIAVFSCSVQCADTETKGTVLINSAQELMNFNKSEELQLEKILESLKDSGVNLIVTGGTVDDLAQHFLEKFGILCLKVTSKFELRRLTKTVNATTLVTFGPASEEELGYCHRVYVKEYGLQKVTVFEQDVGDESAVATIVLRASTNNILNDVEKAIDDGVNIAKAMGKYKPAKFLAGAGASDVECARRLSEFGQSTVGLEQYAIKKFAEAFEVIPRTLAENAGLNAIDIMAALYSAHEKGDQRAGVDIENGCVGDVSSRVLDLLVAKKQALELAIDATLTVLRVDQIIQAKPAGGPKIPRKEGGWDNDD